MLRLWLASLALLQHLLLQLLGATEALGSSSMAFWPRFVHVTGCADSTRYLSGELTDRGAFG